MTLKYSSSSGKSSLRSRGLFYSVLFESRGFNSMFPTHLTFWNLSVVFHSLKSPIMQSDDPYSRYTWMSLSLSRFPLFLLLQPKPDQHAVIEPRET